MAEPKIIRAKIADLTPDQQNINKGSEYGNHLLGKSLEEGGLGRSVLLDKHGNLIAGNKTTEKAAELGFEDVIIIPTDGKTLVAVQRTDIDINSPEGVRLKILDNTVSRHNYVEDADVAAALCEEYAIDAKAYGLNTDREEIEAEPAEDDYEMPSTGDIGTDIVLGDLFEIGQHKLLCGSSLETDNWEKLFAGKLADLVVTDPPYNVAIGSTDPEEIKVRKLRTDRLQIQNDDMSDEDFFQFLYDFHTALGAYTKPGGAWYVWHADGQGLPFRRAFTESGLLLKQCLIWVKNVLILGRQDYQWRHEPCLYGWKPGAGHYFTEERHHSTVIEDRIDVKKMSKAELQKFVLELTSDKTPNTVLHVDKPTRSDLHPTMKPILLLAPLIQNSSKRGEIVADGFLGSGSTMVAAHQLGRICYGTEIDPRYCQAILSRMRQLAPDITIKRNGETWEP